MEFDSAELDWMSMEFDIAELGNWGTNVRFRRLSMEFDIADLGMDVTGTGTSR